MKVGKLICGIRIMKYAARKRYDFFLRKLDFLIDNSGYIYQIYI